MPLLIAGLALASACSRAAAPDPNAPLVLERTIDLPGVRGRIDHLAYDSAHRRLFVAELGNGLVEAIDLGSGRTVRASGLNEPQGIGYLPKQDAIAIACGGDGSLRFFDAATLKPLGMLRLGDDADNVRIDPAGHVVVGYGSGGLVIVDPERRTIVRAIALPAHPEAFQIAPDGHRAFVNLPGAHKIALVALDQGRIDSLWPASHGANFPMALSGDGLLAIAFRAPAHLVLLDPNSGAVRQDLPTCGDADDVFFDERRGRIMVSCGAGRIALYARNSGGYAPAGEIETRSGARTSLFAPELDRLFVAAPAAFPGREAAILVYRPKS
ncbi:MAG TPA: hypothetical protein VH331_16255 [Allosphingosinicella sp.]|nr:hypothetical protein [Allosphingosinicella sp.]